MDNQNNSGVNTVLIVVILVILVGALVWFFTKQSPAPAPAAEQDAGFEIDVNMPEGSDEAAPE
jgi:hypothetical protein